MRYGLELPNMGAYADVHALVELACLAEEVGWDGVFLWDTVYWEGVREAVCDPWVALAAIAVRTERIRLGALITPLSRRHIWKVARETVTLDHLSRGRLIVGVGLGDLNDGVFTRFGEVTDARQRARMLDEGLDVLVGLWSGQPFSYSGEHYQLRDVTFLPTPVQSPRIPIWVGGYWPNKKPMRRAARWDGALPGKIDADGTPGDFTSADAQAVKTYINEHRSEAGQFDIIHGGMTPGDDPEKAHAIIEPFAEAGATWWLESAGPWPALDLANMRTRIQQRPPRIDKGASITSTT